MGWRQYVRAVEADNRRALRARIRRERDFDRANRQVEREARAYAKAVEKQGAADEVGEFEEYLDSVLTVHAECGGGWDWQVIASAQQPVAPQLNAQLEAGATAALETYRPGLFARMFGGAARTRAQLEAAIASARVADAEEHRRLLSKHAVQSAAWERRRQIALSVLAGELGGYRDAFHEGAPFKAVVAFGTRVTPTVIDRAVVSILAEITDDEIVPTEEVKLTKSQKLSTKQMAASKYWALYQDHVCGSAIRVAGETLALLPVERVIVNIGRTQTDTSTGRPQQATYLAVHFSREALHSLNLEAIDPSDAMKNFPHRMKFKKTARFEPVEPMTPDEQWVTT